MGNFVEVKLEYKRLFDQLIKDLDILQPHECIIIRGDSMGKPGIYRVHKSIEIILSDEGKKYVKRGERFTD